MVGWEETRLPLATQCFAYSYCLCLATLCSTMQHITKHCNTEECHNAFPILIACATCVATIAIQWLGQSTVQCFTCCHNATWRATSTSFTSLAMSTGLKCFFQGPKIQTLTFLVPYVKEITFFRYLT